MAEWGIKDGLYGTEDNSDDLPELIDNVIEDLRQAFADVRIQRIEWNLDGDTPLGKSMEDMVAEAGVTLPDRLPEPRTM